MILGYSTNAFVKYSLEESLEHISELGFKGVEIMCDKPHLYPPEYPDRELEKIKAQLDKLSLSVTNLNSFTLFAVGDTYLPSWIEDESDRREIRIEHTLQCLKVAAKLNCRNISIPPGGPLNGISRKKAMTLFHAGLEKVIPLAQELDIRLLVEPEPDLLIERTSEFLEFIKDVQSPQVGINFDIGHFYCAGENPAQAFETLFEWVGHVHIEDIGASRVHQHLIAGDGAIEFEQVFQIMQTLAYRNDISLELYPYADKPIVAGQKSIEFLRPLLTTSGLPIL